jgi:response regulator of citrate/malate metabolism
LSAAEVAAALGIARATGQYLTALAESGAVEMRLRYGVTGRSEHEFPWASGG